MWDEFKLNSLYRVIFSHNKWNQYSRQSNSTNDINTNRIYFRKWLTAAIRFATANRLWFQIVNIELNIQRNSYLQKALKFENIFKHMKW